MARRVAIILGLVALLNFYAGHTLIGRMSLDGTQTHMAWILVAVFFVLQLAGPFGDRLFFKGNRSDPAVRIFVGLIDWLSYLAFGILSCLVFYGFIADIVTLAWQLLAPPTNPEAISRTVLWALAVATGATVLLGIFQSNRPRVRIIEVPLARLPAAFDGFKIAQISDLHVGPTIGRAYTQKVVDMTNTLKPDAIALTGDFIDGAVADLMDDVAPLADLRARDGVFFVTGNHEYFWDAGQWIDTFRKLGARVLINEHEIIRRGHDAIVMAGVTDISTRHMTGAHASNPTRAANGAPEGLAKILLAHQPTSYNAAEAAGFDLQLSGHTHAGQYFPYSLLIGFFQRFAKGLNRFKNMWIYVNQGTGYWGPPLRTGVPPEITLLTLRRAS